MKINHESEAALMKRAAIAQKELRQIRRQLREDEDRPFGRDVQEDGMLRQANPHGHHGGARARD